MSDRPSGAAPSRLVAVLGPTNTGKTHLAVERMLGHASGMIGLPLRLLAREVYDRVVRLKGARSVALITGEEKIVPPGAKWFACTVEAMPLDRRVEFVAVDEIQLCADPDRGHVFTDRLLNARGMVETMFMGAETIRPLLQRLVPQAEMETRPRLSQLTHAGPAKLTRLPPRSAVVAFSAAEVYAIAEAIRRRRGGCAGAHRGRAGDASAVERTGPRPARRIDGGTEADGDGCAREAQDLPSELDLHPDDGSGGHDGDHDGGHDFGPRDPDDAGDHHITADDHDVAAIDHDFATSHLDGVDHEHERRHQRRREVTTIEARR